MAFSATQIKNLGAKLSARCVRTRKSDGRQLSYLEGWHVIAEANRIFGFDAWDRETISNQCIWEGMKRGCPACAYVAKVRITVRAGPFVVTREGSGSGQGNAISPGEAHENALKAAETDATKRALATFGNPFGLALYDKEQAGVRKVRSARAKNEPEGSDAAEVDDAQKPPRPIRTNGHYDQVAGPNGASLRDTSSEKPQIAAAETAATRTVGTAPDKSALAIAEPRRVRKPEHLRYVGSQPCIICGRRPSEAHHLTFAQPRALSMKTSDEFTVPLCRAHHRQLHSAGNEEGWWRARDIDAVAIAEDMWAQTTNARQG